MLVTQKIEEMTLVAMKLQMSKRPESPKLVKIDQEQG